MNQTPLHLEKYHFTKVSINSGTSEAHGGVPCATEVSASFAHDQNDERHFRVELSLELVEQPGTKAHYTGQIVALGFFRVDESYPIEKATPLVTSTATSLLYGAMREMLCNITSRMELGGFVLNTTQFPPLSREQLASMGAKQAAASTGSEPAPNVKRTRKPSAASSVRT